MIKQAHKHIVYIQEPYCPVEYPALIPHEYDRFFSVKKPKPWALILVSKSYNNDILPHENLSDRDTFTISVTDPNSKSKRLIISSAYMPHNEEIKDHSVIKTIEEAENENLDW